jgi:hypothetical protein
MKGLTTVLLSLTFLATATLATEPDILINGGTVEFDYLQVPSPTVAGHFGSDGSLAADPPNEGTAATTYVLDGLHYLTVIGAVENGTNFIDGIGIVIESLAPITPGTYPLDGVTGTLAFVDDAVGWVPPADLWNTNWTLELASIVAAGKYLSVSGAVVVDTVDPYRVAGSFEALVIDPNTGITLAVSAGTFNVAPPVSVDDTTWASVKNLYR